VTALVPDREDSSPAELAAGGSPPNGHGNGRQTGGGSSSGGDGDQGSGLEHGDEVPARFLRRRRSIWPFLLDLGVVLALFGLIITGRYLIVVGAAVAVVALFGWIREARAEFSRLSD